MVRVKRNEDNCDKGRLRFNLMDIYCNLNQDTQGGGMCSLPFRSWQMVGNQGEHRSKQHARELRAGTD